MMPPALANAVTHFLKHFFFEDIHFVFLKFMLQFLSIFQDKQQFFVAQHDLSSLKLGTLYIFRMCSM